MASDVHWKARLAFAALLCAGGAAALAWYVWSSSQLRTYQMVTHDSVSGLIADSPVEFHGVEVGKVTQVELIDPGTVSILLRIAKDAPMSQATVATITARGLAARGFTGYVYIALENTGAASGALLAGAGQRYPMIPTASSRIDTMDTAVADATEKLHILTRLLQSVLDETTVASLKKSIEGLQEITATLASNNERLNSLLVNAERDSRDVRPLLDASNSTIRELRLQLLPQLYRTTRDLDGLAHSLNGLTNRITRDTSTLLRGTTPPGPGEGR